jgi:hypothetical protein
VLTEHLARQELAHSFAVGDTECAARTPGRRGTSGEEEGGGCWRCALTTMEVQ